MRSAYRLCLLVSVAACAPMLPDVVPLPVAPATPVSSSEAAPAVPASPDLQASANEASFSAWKQGFLDRHGGSRRDQYARQLQGLTPDPQVIRLDRNQPEFSRPAGVYVANATAPARIAEGRQRSDRVPWSLVQRYGVPTEILLGIWAQESSFGRIQGDNDVIRSLATLAHDGRRRDWAETQLKSALDIVIDGRQTREGLRGSWAGAMGQTQFIPETYLRLAVDHDGDGRADIWNSEADALASAANLLADAGWKRGQGWAYEIILPPGFDYALAEGERHPWRFWSERGVRLASGTTLNAAEMAENAAVLLPQGARGPAFLALPNHYVIRSYNNSVAYALAIGLIADGIAGKPSLVTAWPDDPPLSRDQRIAAQSALARLGYDPGGIDGVVGAGTRRALRAWQTANGRVPDGYLTASLADELARL